MLDRAAMIENTAFFRLSAGRTQTGIPVKVLLYSLADYEQAKDIKTIFYQIVIFYT